MALALTLGAAVVGGVGWFLLGWLVVHEPAGNAAGEGLGVAFGVLIVASVIGAVASRRAADPADVNNGAESAEDPETRS